MGQWVYIYGKFKVLTVDVDNSNFKKFVKVINVKPEAEWSNHEQVESVMETYTGGPNSFLLKKIGMTCG